MSGYQLSPSGQKIGYFVPWKGRRTLVTHKLDGTDRTIIPPWDEKMELVDFFWKSEEIVIFEVHMTLKRYEFQKKTSETRQISYDVVANKAQWLGKPKRGSFRRNDQPFISQIERIVDRLLDDPDHILIELDFDLDTYPTLYRANVKTGARKVSQRQRTGTNNWFTDESGEVRLGYGYKRSAVKSAYRIRQANGKWQDLDDLGFLELFEIVDLGPNVGEVYMTGPNKHGTNSMFLVDILARKVIKPMFSNPEVDIDGTVRHPATGKVAGVEFTDDFRRVKYFDEDLRVVQLALERALPGFVVSITDKARDANLYLVLAYNDTDPGQYYVFNRDGGSLDYFASYRAEIEPGLSASTRRVDIPVRDGSNIPGYLTLPKNREESNLPALVFPHGGPHVRDSADWHYAVQFAASRGYAVLRPNFRGSSGYGEGFKKMGERQWGGLMQEDVTDATRWLISEGLADPDRVCIVGASYGGYAAMMGLIQEPDLYACGISINGVMDLPALKSADRNYIGGRRWIKNMGLDGAKDKEVSPQQQAKRIGAPVLLVAAKNDARISYKQTERFHKTLKRLKKDSTYVELETGTHYMLNRESRHAWLEAAEVFLSKHLQ